MKTGLSSIRGGKRAAAEVLKRLVGVFETRGWLNRQIVIRNGRGRYRLFCSESRFLVCRMNESWGIPPGAPGWPVCMVTREGFFHDRSVCAFAAEEPQTDEWLRVLVENDFEVT
jgi:hypothetical protein